MFLIFKYEQFDIINLKQAIDTMTHDGTIVKYLYL